MNLKGFATLSVAVSEGRVHAIRAELHRLERVGLYRREMAEPDLTWWTPVRRQGVGE